MGWTIQTLGRFGATLETAKLNHVANATRYSNDITAEMIACEWHKETFYAIIRLSGGRYTTPVTFLRVDLIEQSAAEFGYKDQSEEMGPYCQNKPSRDFAKLIYQHIPNATGYAVEFRQKMGIKFDAPHEAKQMELI